ncbi:hypothetical protein MTR_4g107765 [Medicago truncatula]|uniref:Uncharacterized protein n=1 Tax=Medicago truncatula TaxID=3880 RepID=A0A072URE1_MEDTR|nr:hypothetical protein MTR_4g107765 [Medicago truncatula]
MASSQNTSSPWRVQGELEASENQFYPGLLAMASWTAREASDDVAYSRGET